MRNLDKHEWEFCKGEKYAIKWLEEHGFDITIKKRYISKTKIEVEKDGTVYDFSLPLGDPKISYKKVMEQFEKNFAMYCELQKLRRIIDGGIGK